MAKQQKVRIIIPRGYSKEQRQKIGEDIVERIRNRTRKDSIDKEGNKFARYSKTYSKEMRKRKVNLTDTGDMLDELQLLTEYSGTVTVGYEAGADINGKVEGNRLGTYGQSTPIPGKARDFLGITDSELKDILDKYERNPRRVRDEESLAEQASNLSDNQLRQLERLRELGLI